jgi:hypothetical protein
MDDSQLLVLYDKLYFHEIEMREKITSRLQTPFTFVVTLAGVFAFLFQRYDTVDIRFSLVHTTFIFFVAVALGALGFATFNICRAWVNNEYRFMPFADETANYREVLKATYASFPNASDLVDRYTREYIVNEYVNSSAFNAKVNDRRSNSIDLANQQIIVAAAMLLVAFLAFQFGNLDESKLRKPQEVMVTKPIEVKLQR